MISFEEVYRLADKSSAEVAFNRGEMSIMYDLLTNLIDNANVVEIGIQFGRSTTVIGLIAKEKNFHFTAVDNWREDVSSEARAHVDKVLIKELKLPIHIIDSTSRSAAHKYKRDIDFIHIDGDHTFNGVITDMEKWLPKVCKGGYVCFDDYGHDSLPDVYEAVSLYMKNHPEFRYIGRYGNKLGVFERV